MDFGAMFTYFGPLVKDLTGHQWVPAIALVSSYVVMLLSNDSRFPISMPSWWNEDRWKPVAVLVASQVQACIVAFMPASMGGGGMDWGHVVLLGFKSAVWSLGLWALVAKAVYKDHLPKWLLWLAAALPDPKDPAVRLVSPPDPPTGLSRRS